MLLILLVLFTGMLLVLRLTDDGSGLLIIQPTVHNAESGDEIRVEQPKFAITPTEDAFEMQEEPSEESPAIAHDVADATETPQVQKITHDYYIEYDVPFIAQAPFGNWDDPRQQEGCEETSLLMAMHWALDKNLSRFTGLRSILELSDWELETYGEYRDTSAQDTFDWIVRDYFKYENASIAFDIDTEDILDALYAGYVVTAPVDGQALQNPYFSAPGPPHHFIVITGYDPKTDQFITNDPGTKRGEGYRYTRAILDGALRDYPTGSYDDGTDKEYTQTAMITISR